MMVPRSAQEALFPLSLPYFCSGIAAHMRNLSSQGRHLEVIFPTDTDNKLVDDFVAVIPSMAARIYGRRNSKRRAEKIKHCVEQVMQQEESV